MTYRATAHDCQKWPAVLGAPYTWYVGPHESEYIGPCGHMIVVERAVIASPAKDRSHPWWQVPQDLKSQDDYKRWWAAHAVTSTFGYLG